MIRYDRKINSLVQYSQGYKSSEPKCRLLCISVCWSLERMQVWGTSTLILSDQRLLLSSIYSLCTRQRKPIDSCSSWLIFTPPLTCHNSNQYLEQVALCLIFSYPIVVSGIKVTHFGFTFLYFTWQKCDSEQSFIAYSLCTSRFDCLSLLSANAFLFFLRLLL